MRGGVNRDAPITRLLDLAEQIKKLKRKVGELVLDLDIYKEAMRGHPFSRKILDEL